VEQEERLVLIILQELGCEVITLNAQPDGHFPARNPEPNDENLSLLKKTVLDFGADLGIAHDGDADRMMAVDEKGNFVSGDELLTIFGFYECGGSKGTVVVPVDTSMMVDDFLKGSKIVRTKGWRCLCCRRHKTVQRHLRRRTFRKLDFPENLLLPGWSLCSRKDCRDCEGKEAKRTQGRTPSLCHEKRDSAL
jgi:hypothetical protein